MRLKLFLLFSLFSSTLFCQEPIRIFNNNLNNYSKNQPGEGYHYYRFVIDSSTTFKNVELLEDMEYLQLDIRLPEFPAAIDPKKLTKARSVTISGNKLKDLTVLGEFTNIKELAIDCPQLESADFLKTMTMLKSLKLNCPALQSFPLLKQSKIESLHLSISDELELRYLRSLQSLKELIFEKAGFTVLPNSLPLALETLYVSNDQELNDIHNLALYKQLKKITIENTGLKIISGDFSKLSPDEVMISNNNALTDVNALFSIKKINTTIHLSYLPELRSIDLSGKCFDYAELMINYCGNFSEIKGQADCTNFHRLTLINNGFKKFPNLQALSGLEWLEIYEKDLVEIDALKNMKSLKKLELYIPLRQIPESFYSNTALEDLYISNTPLKDLSPVTRFPKLKRLTITTNEQLEKIPNMDYLLKLEYLMVYSNYKLEIKDLHRDNDWRIFSNKSKK